MSMPHDEQAHEIANTLRAILAEAASVPGPIGERIATLAAFGAASADDLTDALDPCRLDAPNSPFPDVRAAFLAEAHGNVVAFRRR